MTTSTASTPSRPHILMMNYHADTNRVMIRLLNHHGYDATAAVSIDAAQEAMANTRFDLMICRNTASDGEPADRIPVWKKEYPRLPIIVMGGGLNDARIAELKSLGVDECIFMPMDFEKLLEKMRVLIKPAESIPS